MHIQSVRKYVCMFEVAVFTLFGGRVATTNLHAHTLARKRHLFIFRFPFTYNIYRLIRFKRAHTTKQTIGKSNRN